MDNNKYITIDDLKKVMDNKKNTIFGLRKFIFNIVFNLLVLILITVIKLKGNSFNQSESIVLITILISYPLFNTISKITNEIFSKKIINTINKLADTYNKINIEKGNDYD